MGRRCHRGGLAEGPDAAAGPVVQRDQRQGAGGHETARLPRSYWDWAPMLAANKTGYFPYTPATNLLYGLHEALEMLMEEGLDNVFARHERHAEATRRAVQAWGLEILCAEPGGIFERPDRDPDARRPRCRRVPQGDPARLRPVARRRVCRR